MSRNKYNIGDKVRVKIHYQNDRRTEVVAVILRAELCDNNKTTYKIEFEPDKYDKKHGCTGCVGYISEDDIIRKEG